MNMLDQDIPASTAEQARLELGLAASGAERSNRPKALLYGAIFLLVVASIYTLTGVRARATALGRVAAARQSTSKIYELTDQVRDLKNQLGARGVEYNPQMSNFLGQLADESHAQPATAITEAGVGDSVSNMQQKRYRAQFIDQDPDNLLAFLNATQSSPLTAGIEIARIEVRPGSPDDTGQVRWKMDVDFNRWERKR